jgi:hypothetical protein
MSDNRRYFLAVITIALCVFGAKPALKRLETPVEKVFAKVVLDYETVTVWRFMGI